MTGSVRIANCSGYFGDRLTAAQEMVTGGPIDVLTGDWLAELTMLILAKTRQRDADSGYARTFVAQMEEVIGECLDRGIRVVSNAGGLNPRGCAAAVERVANRLGLAPTIAYVEGDDLAPRFDQLRAAGVSFDNLDTGAALGDRPIMTANAYIGGWGIADALGQGADIVITGRCTDASLVVGPAAWFHGWSVDAWDALAGAVVAGHVIECGTQATGGNYSFFQAITGLEHPGFPIAEVASDGSSVITKHERHGGCVSIGTVTAQLLYEIGGPRYANPDVVARFDTIELREEGPDRVRVSGVRGEPPPPTLKVCINCTGGHRTTVALQLCGLDIEDKAALFERALWRSVPGGRSRFDAVDVQLIRTDHDDPATNDVALAQLRLTVMDQDETKVGRAFIDAVTSLALANYPGFFWTPPVTQSFGVYWPAAIHADLVPQEFVIAGRRTPARAPRTSTFQPVEPWTASSTATQSSDDEPVVRVPLGTVAGARSGDKGGNANVGLWVETDPAFAWMERYLTVDRLRALLPEAKDLAVERYVLTNLRALNFVIVGLLGEGVASSTRLDAQAKSLGEYLRARHVEVPGALLPAAEVGPTMVT